MTQNFMKYWATRRNGKIKISCLKSISGPPSEVRPLPNTVSVCLICWWLICIGSVAGTENWQALNMTRSKANAASRIKSQTTPVWSVIIFRSGISSRFPPSLRPFIRDGSITVANFPPVAHFNCRICPKFDTNQQAHTLNYVKSPGVQIVNTTGVCIKWQLILEF